MFCFGNRCYLSDIDSVRRGHVFQVLEDTAPLDRQAPANLVDSLHV